MTNSMSPEQDFAMGRGLSPNASRTAKRSMRRNLNRYQLRRKDLIELLLRENWITTKTPLTETGKNSTFETIGLRALAASQKITKEQFARVLMAINKKRGYKSSRVVKNDEDGQIVDGMAVAKKLYTENLTPGQLAYKLLQKGEKTLPDFYRSDLVAEFEKIWNFQKQFYPEIFTDTFKKLLQGKGRQATATSFWTDHQFNTAENKGSREEKKLRAYDWRARAISEQLLVEEAAYVIAEINGNLSQSSGYLGAISDRSKELYFNNQTVGQFLCQQITTNSHARLKNQVFYRQDYLDEFERLWETQAKYYPELTELLKSEIRDVVIFYQRKLKSKKALVSFCQFESKEVTNKINGKVIKRISGSKVCPKSSPLFQEFKIWQDLGHVRLKNRISGEIFKLGQDEKQFLFDELNLKGNLPASRIIKLLGHKPTEWELNYSKLEGNRTNQALCEAFFKIIELEGYDAQELLNLDKDADEISLADSKILAPQINKILEDIFVTLEIEPGILHFNAELDGKDFEEQSAYSLWHLLYAAEDEDRPSTPEERILYGNKDILLKKALARKFGFKPEHTKLLSDISLPEGYSNLSAKALRKMFPFIKELEYAAAAAEAGYNHSSYLTKEENEKRILQPKLELLKKNSLRNPVVEKILNQMVNVVNSLIIQNSEKNANGEITKYFQFDEIRIELARELRKSAKEKEEMSAQIATSQKKNEKIISILKDEFKIINPTKTDIIRYKLYEELKNNGYKDLYTDTYIPRQVLFTKEIDIEHIIPKSRQFDDSFSNKTLAYRQVNLDKSESTAIDFIENKFQVKLDEYKSRVENLYTLGKRKPDEGISKAKYKKLLMKGDEIGGGFIERDIRETQYIAKKAKQMLLCICRNVVATSGEITSRLREDWDLINVMKELNLPKYRAAGLTQIQERKYGQNVEVITDWSKRNDHRHHAMDALAVAFTRHNHIQYLNYLNARKDENNKMHKNR